ncbi:MAG: GNAT family N-acetyltransferase [Pyrinomonadaceae bacterium]|nr:GNAT family N-acetyltransferase [Pyrinomonadaceae bacterium]
MDIKHIEKGGRGAFLIKGDDGSRLAEMTYVTAGEGGFIIDHTEVDGSLRGQGVGDKLLAKAVKYAREKSLKIFATCPFALKKLQASEEYKDVFGG